MAEPADEARWRGCLTKSVVGVVDHDSKWRTTVATEIRKKYASNELAATSLVATFEDKLTASRNQAQASWRQNAKKKQEEAKKASEEARRKAEEEAAQVEKARSEQERQMAAEHEKVMKRNREEQEEQIRKISRRYDDVLTAQQEAAQQITNAHMAIGQSQRAHGAVRRTIL